MAFFPYFLILFSLSLCNPTYELTEDRIEIMNNFIKSQMELAKVDTLGLIVTNKSKTIYKKIYGVNTKVIETTPFVLGSVSKSFTALGLLKLNIPLNDTLDKYKLGNYINEEDSKKITVGELLNHTSGLISFGSKVVNENKGNFSYSNYGFALLGKIIEEKSGKTYNEYMKEAIFNPLKMNDTEAIYSDNIVDSYDTFFGFNTKYTGLESEIGDGFYVPAGFISSSIDDMEKYIQFYLKEENKEEVAKLTEEIAEMDYNLYYGMGISIWKKYNQTLYEHDGETRSFLSDFFIYPELDLGFFLVTNTRDYFCQQPFYDFVNSIEAFLIGDTFVWINDSAFFYAHFAIDLAIIIGLAIPLIYLIIAIKRKVKREKYSWFKGIKGNIIFIIDLFFLIIVPVGIIICFYVIDSDLRYTVVTTRDIRFAIFTFLSLCLLIFLVKLVYIFIYNKFFKKYELLENKKMDEMMLDSMGVSE
jgi:CubicO group peptidase (beta-lactamase class C family)